MSDGNVPAWCPPALGEIASARGDASWQQHGVELTRRLQALLTEGIHEIAEIDSGLLIRVAIGDRSQVVALYVRDVGERVVETISLAGEAPSGPRLVAALAANATPSAAGLVVLGIAGAEYLCARAANPLATLDDPELVRLVFAASELADGWEERYAEEDLL